jgi:hypothetical protein
MKKKAKKFGTGGTILTGLGAGFVGSAIYDKLMKNKEDKEDKFQSLKSVDSKGRSPQEQIDKQVGAKSVEPETKAAPKEETREEYLAKKVKPIKETGTFSGSDTTEPDTDVKDNTPAPAPVKKVSTSKPTVSSSTAVKMAPPDNADLKPKSVPKAQPKKPETKMPLPSSERPSKPYPTGSKYDLEDKAKSEDKPKPAKPKTAPVTRYSKDKEKGSDSKFVPRHLRNTTPFKKGGMVKKYNGGSASSRGDGIAQRGKTRGRMV